MAGVDLSEIYSAVCEDDERETNPHVLQVLRNTTVTDNLTLTLKGNNRLKPVQRLNDTDIFVLSKCLKNNKYLTGLNLRFNNITDKGVVHIVALLQEGSALQSLDLKFNDIQTDGAEVLAKSLQSNRCLLALRLSGNKIGNVGAMHVAAMLQLNQTLREVELADCDLATQSVIALSIVLKSNKSLLSVDISRPLLFSRQEEWSVHFSEMLKVNSSLTELHLGKMELTDTGMERLSEGLTHNHCLRYLDLRCNRVTRDGVRHLSVLLQLNNTLQVIDLSANRIQDDGAKFLSDVIAQPGSSLRELSVSSNNIRTEGLLSLSVAMTLNPTLTHLYIWGNHLEQPVCLAFQQLISSGRLPPEQTDVSAYTVDGRVFLSEVFNSLRKHYQPFPGGHSPPSTTTETTADCDNANGTLTDHATMLQRQQLAPLQPC